MSIWLTIQLVPSRCLRWRAVVLEVELGYSALPFHHAFGCSVLPCFWICRSTDPESPGGFQNIQNTQKQKVLSVPRLPPRTSASRCRPPPGSHACTCNHAAIFQLRIHVELETTGATADRLCPYQWPVSGSSTTSCSRVQRDLAIFRTLSMPPVHITTVSCSENTINLSS